MIYKFPQRKYDDTTLDELKSKPLEQLEVELWDMLDEDVDVREIDMYLEAMDAISPMEYDFDPAKSYARFKRQGIMKSRKNKRSGGHNIRRSIRRAAMLAAVVALMLAAMMVAQAGGMNVFETMGEWTDEIFTFVSSNPSAEVLSATREKLEQEGLKGIKLPGWLPEGFELQSVASHENDAYLQVSIRFAKGDKDILYRICTLPDSVVAQYQKDEALVVLYEHDEVQYYLMENLGMQVACWVDEVYDCTITGNIGRDELVKIIDSF